MATNMTFVDFVTPVPADWLNNVNYVVNHPGALANQTTVASISALRSVSKTTFQSVTVAGYYTGGDGGGGTYVYIATDTTSSDNGGTIIVGSDSGRWYLINTTSTLSIKQFGAKVDGVTDDTVAVQATINWAQAFGEPRIVVPSGVCKITSTISITAPVRLMGAGNGFQANGGFSTTTGSSFLWAGSNTPMFTFTLVNFSGWGMEGILLDANNSALKCVVIDACVGGYFKDVTCRNWYSSDQTSIGIHLTASTANTCSWNLFENINLDSINNGNAALRLSGFVGKGNACHNTFINTRISHGSACNAIALGGCDNISFLMTYIYRQPGGTGYGVVCDTSEQVGFPVANEFFHLQAGPGGYYQPNGSDPYNATQIYGYSLDNGQPEPIVPNGGCFGFTNAGQMLGARSIGGSVGGNLGMSLSVPAGATSYNVPLPSPEPDTNYFLSITFSSDPGSRFWISAKSTTSFTLNFGTALAGILSFDAILIRK